MAPAELPAEVSHPAEQRRDQCWDSWLRPLPGAPKVGSGVTCDLSGLYPLTDLESWVGYITGGWKRVGTQVILEREEPGAGQRAALCQTGRLRVCQLLPEVCSASPGTWLAQLLAM